jgi:hypothetical protein
MSPLRSARSAVAFCLLVCAVARADIITVDLNASHFGSLSQGVTNSPSLGCGPTAAVNSFTFLQNTYPDWYQWQLIPTNPVACANLLMTSPYMGTPQGVGTTISRFVTGKNNYLNGSQDQLPPTVMAAMVTDWNQGEELLPPPPPSFVTVAKPTPEFLLGGLNKRADIEVLILFPLDGHYLTVTGMTWDTIFDEGTIRYVDPTDGSPHSMGFFRDTSGTITVFYTDPASGQSRTGVLHSIVTEVPAPAAAPILCAGALWAAARRRRVKAPAASPSS